MAFFSIKLLSCILIVSVALFCITVVYYEERLSALQTQLSAIERRVSTQKHHSSHSYAKEESYQHDNTLIMYNRVPKTGSTTLMGVAYDLCGKLGYSVLHLNTSKNAHVMSLVDQMELVTNVTSWKERLPALYHGHVAFMDFAALGLWQRPLYINVIRRPMERLISHYYFLRYGDDFRPHLIRTRMGDTETFDDCVRLKHKDCQPNLMWLQVPFFCGMSAFCWEPGSRTALQQAKHNVVHQYLLVGTTERLTEFIAMLEHVLPRFFRGASDRLSAGGKSHLRKTQKKLDPAPETVAAIQSTAVWKVEHEFYQFVESHFNFVKQKTLMSSGGQLVARPRSYHYEKIRPK